ncbi:hypothetical protein [Taibaiella helva]|uniref:hypothetical protein n=1 Tax=Taibaiella helva TaxID=2301235 RepID=UPI0013005994|nr:hypothetical protein [Taibaiella helva]
MLRFRSSVLCTLPILLLAATGCSKKETTVQQPRPAQVTQTLPLRCAPDRNVIGYLALCSELNAVGNCDRPQCTGTSTTIVLTSPHLSLPTLLWIISSNQTITIAEQNQIIQAANTWANANNPTGYTIRYIEYKPDIIVSTTSTSASLYVVVTYQKCTGGGGPIG